MALARMDKLVKKLMSNPACEWCTCDLIDQINYPVIKSHVGIWYALTCEQHGRGVQNLQILLKVADK